MTQRWPAIWMLALAVAMPSVGLAAEEDLATARKAVRQTYGQRIDAALASPEANDNMALARELLGVAEQTTAPAARRFALADAAAQLAGMTGRRLGRELARKAMTQAEALHPYPPADKARREMDMTAAHLKMLQSHRADIAATVPVARKTVQATVSYVQAALPAVEGIESAAQALRSARTVIAHYNLDDLKPALEQAEAKLAWSVTRRNAIAAARQAMQVAREKRDGDALRAAKIGLGKAYLEYDGDVAAAARQLDGTGHELESAVKAAVAQLTGKQNVPREDLLGSVASLFELVGSLQPPARQRLGESLLKLCEAYLAGASEGPGAVKARLYRMRLEKILKRTPADKMLAALRKAYGPLHCGLEVLENGRVRVTYDFSDPKQLDDWEIRRGDWAVTKGALVCTGGEGRRSRAGVTGKLRFRADRPVCVSFKGSALYDIGFALPFYRWRQGQERGGYVAVFRRAQAGTRDRQDRRKGLMLWVFGTIWEDEGNVLTGNKTYRMTFRIERPGSYTWSINGATARKQKADNPPAQWSQGYLRVRLETRTAVSRFPTGFDNVVIEGELLPEPQWQPPKPEGNGK